VKQGFVVALIATLFCLAASAVSAAQFEVDKLEKALAAPPHVPQQTEDLINSFLDHTLPKLLANDEGLAHRLGFGERMGNQVSVDRAFSVMLIRREDVMSLLNPKGKSQPIDLVNNTNNWLEDESGRLVPKRIVFLLKASEDTAEVGGMRSSVTIEQSGDGSSWRIIQIGAPKLSQAMNQHGGSGGSGGNSFLLWIPDLNRHYLGTIQNHLVTLKVLFRDRLLNGDPGDAQPITPEYLAKLKRLYEELDLPKKLRRPEPTEAPRRTQSPAQTQPPIPAR
jgi:hypothetical protein